MTEFSVMSSARLYDDFAREEDAEEDGSAGGAAHEDEAVADACEADFLAINDARLRRREQQQQQPQHPHPHPHHRRHRRRRTGKGAPAVAVAATPAVQTNEVDSTNLERNG